MQFSFINLLDYVSRGFQCNTVHLPSLWVNYDASWVLHVTTDQGLPVGSIQVDNRDGVLARVCYI